jgi:hypothetical protein
MARMAEFKKNPKLETASCMLYSIEGFEGRSPVLIGRPATERNKPYFNEQCRRSEHLIRRKARLSAELVADNRNRDRELYPKFVLTGWKDVIDADGKLVVYSQAECEAFLRNGLDDDIFDDEVRAFFSNEANFRQQIDGGAAAGNSQTV